jgi:hypothetical protein
MRYCVERGFQHFDGSYDLFLWQTTTIHRCVWTTLKRPLWWWNVSMIVQRWGSTQLFLSHSLSFLSHLLENHTSLQKLKGFQLFCFDIKSSPYSFDYYLFCFKKKLICFSILSLNLLFYLIFISNLILIFFIVIC